jgi:hypothetical protein
MAGDNALGWCVVKNGKGEIYESNSEGVRAPPSRTFGPKASEGKIRIVAVGDSFTHGDEVKVEETWESELENVRKDLEVLNLGVPAYGTDQAFLRWRRDAPQFNADISILGIWPEDICRNLNIGRFFLNPASEYSTKPRFILEAGALVLVNSPVVQPADLPKFLSEPETSPLLKSDYWYSERETTPKAYQHSRALRTLGSILNLLRRKTMRANLYSGTDPAGDEITVKIAETFAKEAKEAKEKGSLPLVLLIPMRDHLEGDRLYAKDGSLPLVAALKKAGLEVLDLSAVIAEAGEKEGMGKIYLKSGHLTPRGNRVLAEGIAKKLEPYVASLHRPEHEGTQ